MMRTYTLPETREEALHRSEMHLSRALHVVRRPWFTVRLIDALLGVGYAVMALSLHDEAPVEGGE